MKNPLLVLFVLLSLRINAAEFKNSHALNNSDSSYEQNRPDSMSDAKWSGFKLAVQEAKLAEGSEFDLFGIVVSLDKNRILIGAPNDDDSFNNSGAAYVYDFSNNMWSLTIKLTASDSIISSNFGSSVSLLGDRALIGANGDNNIGSAYIFELTNGDWMQVSKLIQSDGASNDDFGSTVSLSVDRALVGAPNDDNKGSAYIFEPSGGSWVEIIKLVANDGAVFDGFGASLDLSINRALIGAENNNGGNGDNSGSVYIFELSGVNWSLIDKLISEDGNIDDSFGSSVSLSGDRALIGARFDGDTVLSGGSAYIFDFINNDWSQTVKLVANDISEPSNFGASVSLSNETAIIGAFGAEGNAIVSGAAYIFELSESSSWVQTNKLIASDGATNDRFGSSVSLFDDKVLIGSLLDDDFGENSGSVYVINLARVLFADSFE
jgi:hypothetical protein